MHKRSLALFLSSLSLSRCSEIESFWLCNSCFRYPLITYNPGVQLNNVKSKATSNPRWRRVVLKISGAALACTGPNNIDPKVSYRTRNHLLMYLHYLGLSLDSFLDLLGRQSDCKRSCNGLSSWCRGNTQFQIVLALFHHYPFLCLMVFVVSFFQVAIVVGSRNFFCGGTWISATGLDRTTAYHIRSCFQLIQRYL